MKSILNFKRAGAALCTMSLLGLSGSALAADINVPGDKPTIQAAVDAAAAGDTIRVASGDHAGAYVTKAVTIKGQGGARITSGPPLVGTLMQGFRLTGDASDATISHLTFTTEVDFPIYARFLPGEPNTEFADNVTVTQCTFLNNVQAITNWGGRAWEITHNTITDIRTSVFGNGGGIGILIGDRDERDDGVKDNLVSHNTITGQLNVPAAQVGGFNGVGIVIFADFRFAFDGTEYIAYNRVVKNKVSLTLNNEQTIPHNVDVVAFEMTVAGITPDNSFIFENAIGFNDWRGTVRQIELTPMDLEDNNFISRNFGENRGHGLHPSVF